MSYNGIDRKDRAPSPNSSGHENVVDHHAAHGMCLNISVADQEIQLIVAVTDEPAAGRRTIPDPKSHMITVQPLKRSEMQVSCLLHSFAMPITK